MKKQHFQTIFKTGMAILLCSMVLAGCGTKNQQNVTTNITTVGNTALEQPMRLEALKMTEWIIRHIGEQRYSVLQEENTDIII